MMARRLSTGIESSRVSPAYLHANSTSHTWAFSAVAELIDNAYDPDVKASEIRIDQRMINNKDCLTFVDDGFGMSPDKLHKMLSFGYCEKVSTIDHQAVGQYGNGFKSESMRLGKDAIVFTRQADSMSRHVITDLLGRNSCRNCADTYRDMDFSRWRKTTSSALNNLTAFCHHSLFESETSLLEELHDMEKLKTGTKIIIYNLRKTGDGSKLELDFSSDPTDIRNPETLRMDFSTINRVAHEHTSAYVTSLREYCSILYLKPRMKIFLRGKKVMTKLINQSLSRTATDRYKPTWAPKPIPIRFGFNSPKNPDYGVMLYHKNRLIRAYEKVGCQKQPNELGVGVVGVVEAYFLTPTHNKQDFSKDDKYNAFIGSVSQKLRNYWNVKMGNGSQPQQEPQNDALKWTWAQCDNCLKWRRLPILIRGDNLPDMWFCYMNPDAQFNRCDIEEEPEDEDEALRPDLGIRSPIRKRSEGEGGPTKETPTRNGGPSVKRPRIDPQIDIKPDIGNIKTETETEPRIRDIGEYQQLAEEYRGQLTRLQRKVLQLLKIIAPNEDIGTPDGVEEIVTEMINLHQPSS